MTRNARPDRLREIIRDVPKSGSKLRTIPLKVNMPWRGGVRGRVMPMLLGDILLFFCLAAWASGIVIAIASLLS